MVETIALVDYGMGNLNSVEQALRHVCGGNRRVVIATAAETIRDADKVVFPGQGAAGASMREITAKGLGPALVAASREKPFLGICMGLQILMTHSEENDGVSCLDIFAGEVTRLNTGGAAKPGHKIPHMGWNRVRQAKAHPLWERIDDDAFFYFAHSYRTRPDKDDVIAATSEYGGKFACALARDFVFAAQFHPEKSAAAGLRLLKNFAFWNGSGQTQGS